MTILKGALLGAALLAAGPALAQKGEQPPTVTPFYIGAHYGQTKWKPGCFPGATSCDASEPAGRALAGWQFNDIFAVELAYNNLGKASSQGFFVKANAWELAGLAAWHFNDGPFSVYGKFGTYRGAAENNVPKVEINYGVTWGGGLAFDVTRNITVRGEWQRYEGISGGQVSPESDVDVLGIGVLWRFR